MFDMKRATLFLAVFLFASAAFTQKTSTVFFDLNALNLNKDDFHSSFKNPPLSYAPFVRWWWPGNDVETNELQREIDLFARHHIGGVEIQSFALVVPPPMERMAQFMSFDTDVYYSNLKTVMEAALHNGMTVDLTNGSGWPASGSHISEAEENRSLRKRMTEMKEKAE